MSQQNTQDNLTHSQFTMDNNKENTGSSYANIVTVKFAQAQQPKYQENKAKGYVEFGKDNDYPEYLLGLYSESAKHGAIVKGKVNYIFGKGFDNIPKPANKKESWNQIAKRCILDDELYGGYYLQIIFNLAGAITDVYHIEFYKVRSNKAQNKFFVKTDWKDNAEKMREYPAFTGVYDSTKPTCILFVKQYNPKADTYPVPNYYQGLNYIESDVQVSRWILGNAKDGFAAGKSIQFFNGDPVEEQKGQVEKSLKKKFSGSEGDRIVLIFSKPGETPVAINDLGNTMLTKEDFNPINLLIQQEIFSSHQVTSPMLFGIKTEGQLGGRTELTDAYEIFNNTYINERQQAHEETFNALFKMAGITGDFKITPVEPLGFTLKDDMLLDVMPREYFLDKLGADQKYYALPPARTQSAAGVPATGADGLPIAAVNENLSKMSGRQFQQLERVVRKFKSGKITREAAAMMLKNSFGISDEEVGLFLDADSNDQQFASQEEQDFALVEQFSAVGENADLYDIVSSKPAKETEYFADVKQLNELEANVLNLIKKDSKVTADVLATVLKQDVAVVSKIISGLVEANILSETVTDAGTERAATDQRVGGDKPSTVDVLLRYSYNWRDIVPVTERNTTDHPSRPFCVKMMQLNRLYSRQDIETISARLGYSVWDRVGGWWTDSRNPTPPQCRHEWFALTVIRKKQ